MQRSAIILSSLALAAACLAPALAAGPTEAQLKEAQAQAEKPGAVETLKRTMQAQAEVSPQTKAALSGSPEAMRAIGQGGQPGQPGGQQQPPGQPPKSKKAIYGDIVIHK